MSNNKQQIDLFISTLKEIQNTENEISINGRLITLNPLTFKQQKQLLTRGLDGLVGVIDFIKELNTILLENTGIKTLSIVDRTALVLHLRKLLSNKDIDLGNDKIAIDSLIDNIKDFEGDLNLTIDGDKFVIHLSIPTLVKENKFLDACISEMKPLQDDGLGENISTMLAYEIPKFIHTIEFGENIINFDDISMKDKIKIVNNLPATIVSKISDFISTVSKYDENILTVGEVTVELDSSLFE